MCVSWKFLSLNMCNFNNNLLCIIHVFPISSHVFQLCASEINIVNHGVCNVHCTTTLYTFVSVMFPITVIKTSWQKHLTGERVNLGSQFKVTVQPSQWATVVGAEGSHCHCISSEETELNGRLHSALFTLYTAQNPQPREWYTAQRQNEQVLPSQLTYSVSSPYWPRERHPYW